MQIFLFGALAVSLVAVMFALQNIGPVTVAFLAWTFQGSLALVLFIAFITGAFASFLASVPTLVRGRWAGGQHRKQVAALEGSLAECQRKLQEAEARLHALPKAGPPAPASPSPRTDATRATLERSS